MMRQDLIQHENSLQFWQASTLAPFNHGFFTRKGGKSKGAIAALNCGYGADEPREIVNENRELVAQALGAPNLPQTVYQHHSSDVITLDKPFADEPPKADALVTNQPLLPIGILTADCAPVLFADKNAGIIGAAHAGWRGAVGGVLENTVDAMRALGASDIRAVIGPLISMNNYEVGQDFVDNLLDINPAYSEYLAGQESYHFNLPRFVLDRLRDADVDADWLGECTYANPDLYYSYRYSQHNSLPDYGRLLSTIMIPA